MSKKSCKEMRKSCNEFALQWKELRQVNNDGTILPIPLFLKKFDNLSTILNGTQQTVSLKEKYLQLLQKSICQKSYQLLVHDYVKRDITQSSYDLLRMELLKEDKKVNKHLYSIKYVDNNVNNNKSSNTTISKPSYANVATGTRKLFLRMILRKMIRSQTLFLREKVVTP
jgi:hypothetical protein